MNQNYETYFNDATELLKQLIATPSVSRDEKAAANIFCKHLDACGISHQRIGNNIICAPQEPDSQKPTLLLNAHIDTVKPAAGWQRDPFTPSVEDGKLYGLGSSDCGGGLVSLLQAYRILSAKPQHYNLVYAVSAEEEVSGKDGFTLMLPHLPRIDVALVGEPTSLQPAIAEKGLMVLDITATGKAGHAARNEGVNALYKAVDQINWIRNYKFPKVSPTLGEMKMTATIIQAGTLHNCIPDKCTYTVDVRTTDCYTNQEVLDFMTSQLDAEVKARSTRLGSSRIDPDHPIIAKCRQLGLQPFGSPTLSDQALMPWPSFKLGPGDSMRSHTADEYIPLADIARAIDLYVNLLDGISF
jgi:acetylornithine deacetylase